LVLIYWTYTSESVIQKVNCVVWVSSRKIAIKDSPLSTKRYSFHTLPLLHSAKLQPKSHMFCVRPSFPKSDPDESYAPKNKEGHFRSLSRDSIDQYATMLYKLAATSSNTFERINMELSCQLSVKKKI
jgi:hypothetical protein